MKGKYLITLLLLIGLIGSAAYFTYSQVVNNDVITLGLDLEGGVYVLLEAEPEAGQDITDDTINRAVAVIRNRVDELGTTEPEITREGATRIRVAIPGAENPEEVLNLIGQTALLEFKKVREITTEEEPTYELETFLTGEHLSDAYVRFDDKGKPVVAIELSDKGGDVMREFTHENIGQAMVITLDDKIISMPVVEDEIGKEGIIRGNFTDQTASDLALLLRSGALPVKLTARETRAIGPKLGRDSLMLSLNAGKIGILMVLGFMVLSYRGFGFMADMALIAYITIVIAVLAGINATLTLPGIAGLILGIGMAVDANIIIFERIKEELRHGRTLRSAIDAGFSRAIVTILDANITTLIAAGVLFKFGTASIRGFGVTLALSILGSMFTAVFVTKWLLRLVVACGFFKSERAIGRA